MLVADVGTKTGLLLKSQMIFSKQIYILSDKVIQNPPANRAI